MTREEWIKDAEAGIESAGKAIEKVAAFDWNLDDDTRRLLIKSLLGGAVGASVMGASGALTAGENESRLARALRYAALGGAGGTALTAAGAKAYDLLTGGRQLEGETGGMRPITDTAADTVTSKVLRNPFLTAGTVGGLYGASKGVDWSPDEMLSMMDDKQKIHAKEQALEVLKNWREGNDSIKGLTHPSGKAVAPKAVGPIRKTINRLKAMVPGLGQNMALREAGERGFLQKALAAPGSKKLWYAALPAAMLTGWGADRYLRGDYD